MTVLRPSQSGAEIQWRCGVCDEGVISNWEDSPYDLRRRQLALAGAVTEIVIADELAATLRSCGCWISTVDGWCSACAPTATAPSSQPPMRNWTS